jgi:hypothetical protein
MKYKLPIAFVSLVLLTELAFGQESLVLRDLESKQPSKLSKEELQHLLPGAKMSRVIANGNTHYWANDLDGTFVISSDGKATSNLAVGFSRSYPGKWHISDDGRYCVLIDWRRNTEEWCRYLFKTTDGYYSAKSDKVGTEKVFKLDITGK